MEEVKRSRLRDLATIFTELRLLAVFVVGILANQGINAAVGPVLVRDQAIDAVQTRTDNVKQGAKSAVEALAKALNNHAKHLNDLHAQQTSNGEVSEKILHDMEELRRELDEIGSVVEALRIVAERGHGRRTVQRLVDEMEPTARPEPLEAATVKVLPSSDALVEQVPVEYDDFNSQAVASTP